MNKKTATDKIIIIMAAVLAVFFAALTVITVIWVMPEDSPVLITAPAVSSDIPSPADLSYNDVVYKTPEGDVYHSTNDCIAGEGKEIFLYEAIENDLEPCPNCFKNITPAH